MNNWTDFLTTQGAEFNGREISGFTETVAGEPEKPARLCPLLDRGFIHLQGPDTDKLLQGQLTCDISLLTREKSLSGALCNPKGRMISSFYLIRLEDGSVLLVIPMGLLEPTLETLKKYGVFYKTEIKDASSQYRALGLTGLEANNISSRLDNSYAFTVTGSLTIIASPSDLAESHWQQLTEFASPSKPAVWNLALIEQGIGEVRPETREEFIPQMLNFQHTGAVNFRKGCYTGQEIVARMQYLGKLKRHMYRLEGSTDKPPAPGTPITLVGATQNCGHIVIAEQATESKIEMLAVLTQEAATSSELVIGENVLTVNPLTLPYDITLSAKE